MGKCYFTRTTTKHEHIHCWTNHAVSSNLKIGTDQIISIGIEWKDSKEHISTAASGMSLARRSCSVIDCSCSTEIAATQHR